jgi:hypothetical protein
MKTYQDGFHQEWSRLTDKHVRALAWLLTSPDLLDKNSVIWWHQIGTLDVSNREKLRAWLFSLDAHPTVLHEALKIHKFLRLGHYAEDLLAFYFNHEGLLFGHGVQVHNAQAETIGEFDYLLFAQGGLLHIELATKFYLFHHVRDVNHSNSVAASVYDYLGPNLNDSLGAKMQKILQRQLSLSEHDAAKKMIQAKIIAAQAIIKGWLFYRSAEPRQIVPGIGQNHCLGFWWTQAEFEQLAIPYALRLERLQWLAPAQVGIDEVMDKSLIIDLLHRHFHTDATPVMVAIMKKNGSVMQEFCRGMVVPNDWPMKANQLAR